MVKKSMNWLDLKVWIEKYKGLIEESYIDNIYNPRSGLLILKLRRSDLGTKNLVIEAGKRIHFTKYEYRVVEGKITPFLQFLRKHLRNKKLLKIYMLNLERIVVLEVFSRGETLKLIVELLPRGVVLLTNSDNKIIFASEYKSMKDREIKVGLEYKPPPYTIQLNPLSVSARELYNTLQGLSGKLSRSLSKVLGIPKEIIEEVFSRLQVESDMRVENVSIEVCEEIVKTLKAIIDESMKGYGYVSFKDGVVEQVTPYRPAVKGLEVKGFNDFNEALDYYFSWLERELAYAERLERVRKEYDKIKHSIEELGETIKKYEELSREYRKVADYITLNHHLINSIIKCISSAIKESKNLNCVKNKCKINILNLNFKDREAEVELDNLRFKLNFTLNAFENASKYYSKAKELERKTQRALEAKKQLEERLKRVNEEIEKEKYKVKGRIKPKEWYEKYHWTKSTDGFLIIGGKDASQNESLVKKQLKDHDVFVHADIHGAPAVIIKTNGKTPSENALREAAIITACYSKAWKFKAGFVEVYWVFGRQVSKSAPTGEYLTKGAFMVYGKRNYMKVPLRLTIGFQVEDEYIKVIVGSKENISAKTKYYVVLAPGDVEPSKLSERIKKILANRAPNNLKRLFESLSVEEIRVKIPGPSVIVEVSEGLRKD